MNLSIPRGVALLAALCLVFALMLTACAGGGAASGSDPTETTPPETLPDLTDDRTPADTTSYLNRLYTAFAMAEPAPASDFDYTSDNVGVTVTGYKGGEVVLVIPETIDGLPVIAIGEGAFEGKGSLKALSIPDSVTVIGKGALKGCQAMTTLRTPVVTCTAAPYFGALFGAETHETNASFVPRSLATLIITDGQGMETVPDCCFYDCPMEAIFLPRSVTALGAFSFYNCDKLRVLPLAETALESVGERAMAGCANLADLTLPATVERMSLGMLEGCGNLSTLTIPFVGTEREPSADKSTPRYLGYLFGAADYTFTEGYMPVSLIRVTLLEGCGDIPANAFFGCSFLREVVLPADVTTVGYRAFYRCERLASIHLPASVTTLEEDTFRGCIRLQSVSGGEGLRTLGLQVFMSCVSLETLTLPAAVTYLPNAAFAGCRSLTTLTAPGVTSCGEQVFRHCDKLEGWAEAVTTAAN